MKVSIRNKIRIINNRLTKKSKMGLPLPEEANLCGILFYVQEHEGIITFSEAIPMWGCHTRIAFYKPDKYSTWYIETSSTWNKISPRRIMRAYEVVCAYRGDNFGRDIAIDGSL